MITLPDESKFRDIVESYMQNRLPFEGIHSSFQDLTCYPQVESRPPPPKYGKTEPDLPLSLLSDTGKEEQTDDGFGSELYM